MKSVLFISFFVLLMTLLINTAGAENTAVKDQTPKTPPVAVKAEASPSTMIVVGNKDSKRYHLPGMPYYDKVEKYHRVNFRSEQEAINNGYYKAGTDKDLSGSAPVVTVRAEAASSRTVVVGNKDTKRYHLKGMPYYNKVRKYHRVYFDSEQQAIDSGYYKAGTEKGLTSRLSPAGPEAIKPEPAMATAVSAGPEKSIPETVQKQGEPPDIKTQDKPKVTEELLKPAVESLQEKTVEKETVIDAPVKAASTVMDKTDVALGQKVESDQKDDVTTAPRGVFLTKEGGILQGENIVLSKERPRRLEASFTFDYLRPNDTYGNWHSGNLIFYHKLSPDFTYFLQGSLLNRKEGTGGTGTAGAYKGWTSFLYTCTSVTAGTHSTFLPEFRFDHDFNFSVWPSKKINFLTGISYIDYFDDHRSLIFSGGPMVTYEKWVLHYRLFYNLSYPGSVSSFSHLISLGFGEEGWQWTHLNVSFGKQAYLATYVATPQEVNQNSLSVNLRHRHWLGKYYGVFGDVGYFKLDGGYERYGIGVGAFYEF